MTSLESPFEPTRGPLDTRTVLPVHDITTYSMLVTLVNYDSTVTTTPKSMDFYDNRLAEFKTQLMK